MTLGIGTIFFWIFFFFNFGPAAAADEALLPTFTTVVWE
jgi:hypothetical protein